MALAEAPDINPSQANAGPNIMDVKQISYLSQGVNDMNRVHLSLAWTHVRYKLFLPEGKRGMRYVLE